MLPIVYIGRGAKGVVMGPYKQSQISTFLPRSVSDSTIRYILKFSRKVMSSEDAESFLTFHEYEYPSFPTTPKRTDRIIMPLARYSMNVMEVLDLFGISWRIDHVGVIKINVSSFKKKNITSKHCLEWFHELFRYPERNYVIVEVQRYGGPTLLHVLTNKTMVWNSSNVLLMWKSWIECLRACVRLINQGYFLTDLKSDNMVFDAYSGLYLIDTTIIRRRLFLERSREGKHFTPIMTLYPDITPRQVFNTMFYDENDLENVTQLYDTRCDLDEDLLLSSLLEGIPVHKENLKQFQSICEPNASLTWSKQIPLARKLKELSILNVFYPMLIIMILFLKKQARNIPYVNILREACVYPLLYRMKNYDPHVLIKDLEKYGRRLLDPQSSLEEKSSVEALLSRNRSKSKSKTKSRSRVVTV